MEDVNKLMGIIKKRRSIRKYQDRSVEKEKIINMVKAARLAPSAVNRQPWGFDVQDGSITVYVRTGGPEFTVSKQLDCGIAMLHIEVAALNCGIRGNWQFLKAPQVARFSVLA